MAIPEAITFCDNEITMTSISRQHPLHVLGKPDLAHTTLPAIAIIFIFEKIGNFENSNTHTRTN